MSAEGDGLRKKIRDQLDASGSECEDRGIELDSRYRSAVIFGDDGEKEPEWGFKRYTPSTYPGMRAPHVFLRDGKTSTFDYFGSEWTLVSFDPAIVSSNVFEEVAAKMKIPLKTAVLANEDHARQIWGYDLVLVRADVSFTTLLHVFHQTWVGLSISI